ncbi:hypothetical protein, partial [Pseudomonas sp. GL-RE-20]|uniref:hypothetical protein n=1 Tax=Pseudomonas sp. GL-RE-20 TaxID=2832372 RepID=UPI001CBB17A4
MAVAACEEALLYRRAFWLFYIGVLWGVFCCILQLIDRKPKSTLDGRFWKPIIRPTSGAVETENSLVNKELRSFRQQVASGHRSQNEVEKEV